MQRILRIVEWIMSLKQEAGTRNQHAIVVAAMYKFTPLDDYQQWRLPLLAFCNEHGLKGTVLLAKEGVNATVAGSRQGIDALLHFLRGKKGLSDLQHKESYHSEPPFHRMKVKIKREIVSMGLPDLYPQRRTGTRVDPATWNSLIRQQEVTVIDTRNQYEHEVGTFANAVSAETASFREFPDYVEQNLHPEQHKKIAMFCTGGIRCEKASTYLLQRGFQEVYQLDGGILNYLQTMQEDESLWHGECFVFDGRVALNDKLESGSYVQCFACRRPLSQKELSSEKYQQGISCPYCYEDLTEQRRQGLAERQRQVVLAEKGNYRHIGASRKPRQA